MRLAGVPKEVRFRGLAAERMYAGLGALPENLQNDLYPVGYPNSNYNDVIGNPQWDLMRQAIATGYGELPYAGAGVQNPWFTSAGPGYAFSTSGTMVRTSGETIAPTAPVTGGGGGGAKRGRTQMHGLSGLGEVLPLTTPFPFRIQGPFITGNNFWYTGQPTPNRGAPKYYNDAEEFLRSALVDSDWDRVEAWLSWAIPNGMTAEKLTRFDFGRYKYTGSGATKKYYPFSKTDIRQFYERFLRFTARSSPADADCIRAKYKMAMKAADSNPRAQFGLHLSDCPLTTGWEQALLTMVAMVAIPIAVASIATIAVGAAAAGAGGAGAVGTAGAIGTGGAAGAGAGAVGAASLVPVGIEVVTVAATALPAIGTVAAVSSVGGAIAAGSIIAASPPAPLSPPQITAPPANAPPPVIETVTVTAAAPGAIAPVVPVASAGAAIGAGAVVATSTPPPIVEPQPVIETVTVTAAAPGAIAPVVPVASAGAAIGAGAVVATSTPPPIVEPAPAQPSDVIETVTVEASAPPPPPSPVVTAVSAIPGVSAIVLETPNIQVPEPNPQYAEQEPSLTDRIRDGLTDALEQYGSDYVSQELVDYLTDLLGRPPTQQEIDDWGQWIDDGANPGNAPGSGFLGVPIWAWALFGALFIYAAADSYGGGSGKSRR